MKKQVPNFIKKLRLKKAEKIQEKVMNANNINLIGQGIFVSFVHNYLVLSFLE